MWLLDALPVLSANMYFQVPLVDYLLSYMEILGHQNAHPHQQKWLYTFVELQEGHNKQSVDVHTFGDLSD